MTDMRPPALATWLLKRAARGNDALVGDLFEEHRRRRSVAWYWRQVLTAVVVNRSGETLLVLGIVALFLIGSRFSVPGSKMAISPSGSVLPVSSTIRCSVSGKPPRPTVLCRCSAVSPWVAAIADTPRSMAP